MTSSNDTKKMELKKFLEAITKPTVDLKFFNDAVRNGISLGLAGAIGVFSLEKSPTDFSRFLGGLLLGVVLIILLLNVFQLISAFFVLFDVKGGEFPKTFKGWSVALVAAFLGMAFYASITVIFAGNFRVIIKNIASHANG